MSRVLTRKWIIWHATFVVCFAICLVMGYWQLTRAEGSTGDWQNWVYAIQWPMFAVIGTWGWVRSIYLELHPPGADALALLHEEDEGRVVHFVAQRAITTSPHRFEDATPANPALTAYNARLAALADAAEPADRLHFDPRRAT